MPKYHGKNALIYFGGVNLSGQSNTWSINPQVGSADSDTFSDTWDSKTQGTPSWSAQLSGVAASEGGSGGTLVTDQLFAFLTAGDKPLLIYPVGGGSAKPYFYGTGFISGLPLSGSRKDMYAHQLSIQGGVNGELLNLKTA